MSEEGELLNALIARNWETSNPKVLLVIHKIHKVRPFVSNIGAVTEELSKRLANEYNNIGQLEGLAVNNSLNNAHREKCSFHQDRRLFEINSRNSL